MLGHLVWDREFVNEIKIDEHPNDNFESFALLVQSIVELIAEKKYNIYDFHRILTIRMVSLTCKG